MNARELTQVVGELSERVARLEDSRSVPSHMDTALVQGLIADLQGDDADESPGGTIVYAGAGPWGGETVALQIGRRWDDLRDASDESIARVLSALSSATRIRIVGELLQGPMSTGDLVDRLDLPSSGQLFHHLKELLAAGLIHQPVRGTYAIGDRRVVPMLVVLSAAIDLAIPTEEQPS